MSNNKTTISNGHFITRTNNMLDSNNYIYRNIDLYYMGNAEIKNVTHSLDEEYHLNPSPAGGASNKGNNYRSFISVTNSAMINLQDLKLSAHTYYNGTGGMGTYDLSIDSSAMINIDNLKYPEGENAYYENIRNSARWGIMGSDLSKNVYFTNSKLNRIDAHKGIHNVHIINSTVGVHGLSLIGFGTLLGENIIFDSPSTVITLREDYGSTWDGEIILKDIHWYLDNSEEVLYPSFLSEKNNQTAYFGYKTYFPKLYINNLIVDENINSSSVRGIKLLNFAKNSSVPTDENKKYTFKGQIQVENIESTIPITLFENNFANNEINLLKSTYSSSQDDVPLYLDNSIRVNYTNEDLFKIMTTRDDIDYTDTNNNLKASIPTPTDDICYSNLTYTGQYQALAKEIVGAKIINNYSNKAGLQTLDIQLDENYKWLGNPPEVRCNVEKKEITIKAKDQNEKQFTSSVNNVSVEGLIENHKLIDITLKLGTGALEGKILADGAVIKNNDEDVTENYRINYNNGIIKKNVTPSSGSTNNNSKNETNPTQSIGVGQETIDDQDQTNEDQKPENKDENQTSTGKTSAKDAMPTKTEEYENNKQTNNDNNKKNKIIILSILTMPLIIVLFYKKLKNKSSE